MTGDTELWILGLSPGWSALILSGRACCIPHAYLPLSVLSSLQEVAPLSYAFIGSYFLNPYYERFGEALNLASARLVATADGDEGSPSRSEGSTGGARPPYTLVRAKNVGMTAILMYARDPASIRKIEEAECGFGAADMGNKGAVGLRVTWSGQPDDETEPPKTTELTFVATHLAAMEWNLKKRNANWRSIVSGLIFANPRDVLPGLIPANTAGPTPDRSGAGDIAPRLPTGDSPDPSEEEEPSDSDSDSHPLLQQQQQHQQHQQHQQQQQDQQTLSPSQLASLHAISIYKPSSHLFVAGDLNYRISATTPPPLAAFPSFDRNSPDYYPAFFPRDQLTRERLAHRTLHGLSEHPVAFGPTYKFDVLASADAGTAANEAGARERGEVPWRFAPHRWPAWTDRVLYLDVAPWVAGGGGGGPGGGNGSDNDKKRKVEVLVYDALPVVATSDHRAVVFRARVPVLGAEEMLPPSPRAGDECAAIEEEEGTVAADPRVRLPVPVDVHAWERRAAARRKEIMVGWSAFVWSTREGAVLLATVLAFGVGSWWLWRVW